MTLYATRYNRAFKRIHALHGSPTLGIIPPITSWTLGAGITYNSQYDQFLNASNAVVSVNYATAATATTVNFIPTERNSDIALTIGGALTQGDVAGQGVIIQWTSALQTAIAACWGVTIGSTLYRVKSWKVFPEGAAAPVRIQIKLNKAE